MRNVVHVVLAVLLWIVFVYYWHIVMQRTLNPQTRIAVVSLGSLSFLVIVYLTLWVFHNMRISKRFRRRKTRRRGMREPIKDYMGRWIIVDDPEHLRRAHYIEVEIKSSIVNDRTVEEKFFRTPGMAGEPND